MRIILILWALPVIFFWGWYALSLHDISFGIPAFSRAFHDQMFIVYGQLLQMPPAEVPAAIAGVFAFDTALLLAIAAFRWRKGWYPQTLVWLRDISGWDYEHGLAAPEMISAGPAHPAE